MDKLTGLLVEEPVDSSAVFGLSTQVKQAVNKTKVRKRKHTFSLIEVVIAAMILAMTAVIVVEMNSRSLMKTREIESEWAREHLLSLGCEYYLLWGHQAQEPNELLPPGYSLLCELSEKEMEDSNLQDTQPTASQYVPATYSISLYYQGQEIAARNVTKLVPSGALK